MQSEDILTIRRQSNGGECLLCLMVIPKGSTVLVLQTEASIMFGIKKKIEEEIHLNCATSFHATLGRRLREI